MYEVWGGWGTIPLGGGWDPGSGLIYIYIYANLCVCVCVRILQHQWFLRLSSGIFWTSPRPAHRFSHSYTKSHIASLGILPSKAKRTSQPSVNGACVTKHGCCSNLATGTGPKLCPLEECNMAPISNQNYQPRYLVFTSRTSPATGECTSPQAFTASKVQIVSITCFCCRIRSLTKGPKTNPRIGARKKGKHTRPRTSGVWWKLFESPELRASAMYVPNKIPYCITIYYHTLFCSSSTSTTASRNKFQPMKTGVAKGLD